MFEYYFAESTGVAEVHAAHTTLLHKVCALGAWPGVHVSALRVYATDVDDKVVVTVVLVYALDGADLGVYVFSIVPSPYDRTPSVNGDGSVSKSWMV